MAYMKANNYDVIDAGETITFRGLIQRSTSQAFFLVFCTALGMASLALVLQIQFQDLGESLFLRDMECVEGRVSLNLTRDGSSSMDSLTYPNNTHTTNHSPRSPARNWSPELVLPRGFVPLCWSVLLAIG
jgi:Cofactor assembly of complex C subunit B